MAQYRLQLALLLSLSLLGQEAGAVSVSLVGSYGTSGKAAVYPRGLNQPGDLILGPNSKRLYIADQGNNVIQVINVANLKPLTKTAAGQLNSPTDLTLDRLGQLIVTDSRSNQLVYFSLRSITPRPTQRLKRGFSEPVAVTADNYNRLYVVTKRDHGIKLLIDNKPVVIKQAGGYGSGLGQLHSPSDIEVLASGHVLVAEPGNRRIQVFSPTLSPLQTLEAQPPFDFQRPVNLAQDENGWVYVLDQGLKEVRVFDQNLKPVVSFGKGILKQPSGLLARAGHVWVTDSHLHQLLYFQLR